MPATDTSARATEQEHDALNEKVATQAAEAALCHYAHLNGLVFTDEQFELQVRLMRERIVERFEKLDAKMLGIGI